MKAALMVSSLFLALGLSTVVQAENAPVTCSIQTASGHYLTAVGRGGRTTDVIHSNATKVSTWEKFKLVDSTTGMPNIEYGIQTASGNYLTAVQGGGRITDVIHSDATRIQAWERFTFHSLSGGFYAIKTVSGHYLTAVGGGGRVTDVLHSDATQIGGWEKFKLKCGI